MSLPAIIVLLVLAALSISIVVAVWRNRGLIEGWRKCWRLTTTQASAGLALFLAVQSDVLPLLRPLITEQWWPIVAAGWAIAIIALRIQAQPGALEGRANDAAD